LISSIFNTNGLKRLKLSLLKHELASINLL
jgi:hypothetical protein